METRYFDYDIRMEKRDDGKPVIVGHGAVFNRLSENLGGFREKIDPHAFDSVMQDDVRALINHDSTLILGRTKSGTLKLAIDDTGLRYEIAPGNQTYANDLIMSLERGDITQSSFGFSVLEDSWGKDAEGMHIRTIQKVSRLYDVSPVTFPAYPDADVAKRSLDQYLKREEMSAEESKRKAEEEKELKELENSVNEKLNKLQKWI